MESMGLRGTGVMCFFQMPLIDVVALVVSRLSPSDIISSLGFWLLGQSRFLADDLTTTERVCEHQQFSGDDFAGLQELKHQNPGQVSMAIAVDCSCVL